METTGSVRGAASSAYSITRTLQQCRRWVCTHFITGFVPMSVLAPKIHARLKEGGYWSLVGGTKAAWPVLHSRARSPMVRCLCGGRSFSVDDLACNPAGREEVRCNLERLLQEKDFIDRHCSDEAPRGLQLLYEDPHLGFQILAHINDKARVSPPHDHGDSWAIYGQATKYTDMTEWEREDDGKDAKHAKLRPVKKYRLTPGKAGIYQDGAIHSIDYPDYARFVRVTGTNLDKIDRIRIDLKTGEVEKMYAQRAT